MQQVQPWKFFSLKNTSLWNSTWQVAMTWNPTKMGVTHTSKGIRLHFEKRPLTFLLSSKEESYYERSDSILFKTKWRRKRKKTSSVCFRHTHNVYLTKLCPKPGDVLEVQPKATNSPPQPHQTEARRPIQLCQECLLLLTTDGTSLPMVLIKGTHSALLPLMWWTAAASAGGQSKQMHSNGNYISLFPENSQLAGHGATSFNYTTCIILEYMNYTWLIVLWPLTVVSLSHIWQRVVFS